VDFARLVDFASILNTASITAGTYSQLQMTLSSAQLTVLDTSQSPPAPVSVKTTLTTQNFTVDITPALIISPNSGSALTMDFNLRKSVQTDANGQVTGAVDPQFTLTPATTSTNGELGEADSLYGYVQTVSTTSSNSAFTGSFGLQVNGGVGQVMTIEVNGNTAFAGDSTTSLSNLSTGVFVEVDAVVDTSGNIVAQEVDVGDPVAANSQKSAFLGKVIGVTRDSSGNATAFNLLVGDEVPDLNGVVPLHSSLTITLTANTAYHIRRHRLNPAGFTFGPQTLGLAELVGVFGTVHPGSPPTLTANSVYLRPRTIMGNFNALLAAAQDDKTGGFTMIPCGALFQHQPITVLTTADTDFVGVSGLTALGSQPTLAVPGMLFYQQTNGPAQQPTWTAPTWTQEARRVHQLPQ
jgi:hypothetical protein